MRSAGIYYIYDDADMRNGKAMIIGPEGTPYAWCPLLFGFHLSDDYPYKPPSVTFLTSDGVTRFHPNLYVGGKVCLSILGTWKGPEWSAIMTISTVLSSIQSLLEANPIVNEPSWEKFTLEDPRAAGYAEYVEARLIGLSVRQLLKWKRGEVLGDEWKGFEEVLAEKGDAMLQNLRAIVETRAAAGEKTYLNIPYSMSGCTEWGRLTEMLGATA